MRRTRTLGRATRIPRCETSQKSRAGEREAPARGSWRPEADPASDPGDAEPGPEPAPSPDSPPPPGPEAEPGSKRARAGGRRAAARRASPGASEELLGDGIADEASDLRRRRRRETVDQLLRQAAYLPEDDRLLLEAVYRDGRTLGELAALSGQSPRCLRTRVRRLTRRVGSPGYRFVARRITLAAADPGARAGMRPRDRWRPVRLRIARAAYIEGRSQREIARTLGLSLYTVRVHLAAIAAHMETQPEGGMEGGMDADANTEARRGASRGPRREGAA